MAVCFIPAVKLALERLKDLDNQLRTEGTSLSQEASRYLNEIAEAIKELESSRKAAREELEVETIKTSNLRHQVWRHRDDVIEEISAAVAAARVANAAEMNRLRLEMEDVTRETEIMEERRKDLEGQNAQLTLARDQMKADYDQLIIRLNLQLTEKANTQIQVSETRNEIQGVKEKMARTESARKRLQEELIYEIRKHGQMKGVLEEEIKEITKAIQDQNTMNAEEKGKLDEVTAQLEAKVEEVKECTENITLLERRKARLNTEAQKMEAELEAKLKQSDELHKQKALHERELQALSEELKQKLISLQRSIGQVDAKLEEGRRTKTVRIQSVAEVSRLFSDEKKEEDEALADHNKLMRRLNESKQKLEERFASIAKHKLETKEMQEEMKRLYESNSVMEELFRKKLDDLKMQLVQEKKRRTELELQRDELVASLETFKEQHDQSVREIRSAAALTRSRYDELREEEETLREHTGMDALIEELTQEISSAQEERKQTEMRYSSEIHQLKTEAESITRAQTEEEKKLKDKESALVKVKARFNTELSRHQSLKERTDELQKRKNDLERSIEETKQQTAELLLPKEDLKQKLKASRLKHLQSVGSVWEQVRMTEQSVYESGLMLEQVIMENSRLCLCIERMKEEIGDLRKKRSENALEVVRTKEEEQSVSGSLTQDWAVDKLATEESTERDRELVEEFHSLILKIEQRKRNVGSISSRLERELTAMSALLENRTSD